ncbi:MAG: DUF692 domain-containing protein, partial [Pseudomonas sp.]
MTIPYFPQGAGLGLRRALLPELLAMETTAVDFFECTPDNWINVGGRHGNDLARLAERFPLACHGLSLSLGGPAPLDHELLRRTRAFLDQHKVAFFSEHLSYCSDDGQLYDLLPLPYTEESLAHVASRVRQVQDVLQRPLVLENVSSYVRTADSTFTEWEFLTALTEATGCELLLDVNNVYVSAFNHGFEPWDFISALPLDRVRQLHLAGHSDYGNCLIDTH